MSHTNACKRASIALLLAAVLLVAPSAVRAKVALDIEGIYGTVPAAKVCLTNAWRSAARLLNGGPIANCLRMAFHDAGTYSIETDDGGANGSILKELDARQNGGLGPCAGVIAGVVAEVRGTKGCSRATVADMIQVTGAVAVYLAGGPACNLLMGRPDTDGIDYPPNLPSNCDDVNSLLAMFTRCGFTDPATSLVVLSGAHNIGGTSRPAGPCSRKGPGPLTARPGTFAGQYYDELMNTNVGGAFSSDNTLVNGGNDETAQKVRDYAADHGSFLKDWCIHYKEMSLLGVDVSPRKINYGWAPTQFPPRG